MQIGLIFFALLLAGCASAGPAPLKRLGVISNPQYYDGCECELYLDDEKNKPVYISQIDGKEAWFNIEGRIKSS